MIIKKEDLKALYNHGLVSGKVFNYFEIKSKVEQYERQGFTRTDSVRKVKTMLGCSESAVWNALRGTKDITLS